MPAKKSDSKVNGYRVKLGRMEKMYLSWLDCQNSGQSEPFREYRASQTVFWAIIIGSLLPYRR